MNSLIGTYECYDPITAYHYFHPTMLTIYGLSTLHYDIVAPLESNPISHQEFDSHLWIPTALYA